MSARCFCIYARPVLPNLILMTTKATLCSFFTQGNERLKRMGDLPKATVEEGECPVGVNRP